MLENDYPTIVAGLTPVHNDRVRKSEGVSDNLDHTHYYHNRDIAPYPSND
jgi:hypothetical protein